MSAAAAHLHTSACSCGVEPVVVVDDRPMCGHCFRLGITAAQSTRLHHWKSTPLPRDEEEIEAAVRAALDEFEELKRKMDLLLVEME